MHKTTVWSEIRKRHEGRLDPFADSERAGPGRPAPRRWAPDVIATSIETHVAYVLGLATVDDALRRGAERIGS